MKSLREYIQIIEESMRTYEHLDVHVDGVDYRVEVVMYNGEIHDWDFENTREHPAPKVSRETEAKIQDEVYAMLEPAW